mmetsp:Transcript_116375/g.290611  ORF Transcript_116375/g.290611 Transcript_116375/m.290611 type:complete len:153 (-) Transcript_116375:21-479(-)
MVATTAGSAVACLGGIGVLAAALGQKSRQTSRRALNPFAQAKVEMLWSRLSPNGMVATRESAAAFFGSRFGKLSVDAMFSQVDVDKDGQMTKQEWDAFWAHVKESGYSNESIAEEVDNILNGGAWIDWHDGRHPAHPTKAISSQCSFPLPER